jgi:hypothetical protein
MQRELPKIDFTSQAEVRTNAEHRRAEELSALMRPVLARWSALFQRRKTRAFSPVQFVQMSAGVTNRKVAAGQG